MGKQLADTNEGKADFCVWERVLPREDPRKSRSDEMLVPIGDGKLQRQNENHRTE